jgi:hypothetical protein
VDCHADAPPHGVVARWAWKASPVGSLRFGQFPPKPKRKKNQKKQKTSEQEWNEVCEEEDEEEVLRQ